jgi:regulator of replication initiation timing
MFLWKNLRSCKEDNQWLRSQLDELKDYAKCYVENNEALQKENAELRDRVVDLEQEVESLRHELGI